MTNKSAPSDKLTIPIRRFITKRLISVDQDSTIREGASRMVEFDVSSVGILDDEKVVGIVTDSDLKKKALSAGKSPDDSIKDIMTSPPITVDVNSTIETVLDIMSRDQIKHVLVTERGEVIGITTLKDLKNLDLQELETLIARD